MEPMESPAIARFAAPGSVRKRLSTKGIASQSSFWANRSKRTGSSPRAAPGRTMPSFITTIIARAFPSAMRLSSRKFTLP